MKTLIPILTVTFLVLFGSSTSAEANCYYRGGGFSRGFVGTKVVSNRGFNRGFVHRSGFTTVRKNFVSKGTVRGVSSRGRSFRGGSFRGGSVRGGSFRGGSVRGVSSRRGSVRGVRRR